MTGLTLSEIINFLMAHFGGWINIERSRCCGRQFGLGIPLNLVGCDPTRCALEFFRGRLLATKSDQRAGEHAWGRMVKGARRIEGDDLDGFYRIVAMPLGGNMFWIAYMGPWREPDDSLVRLHIGRSLRLSAFKPLLRTGAASARSW
jgi:hypothetical protein